VAPFFIENFLLERKTLLNDSGNALSPALGGAFIGGLNHYANQLLGS
jgi:hypothetical protein